MNDASKVPEEDGHGVIRRMPQTLPLTIDGDFGPVEGEAWWMDLSRVVFWCPQELTPGRKHLVRVDLGALGRSVDLTVEVKSVQKGAPLGAPLGFVHKGSVRLRAKVDRARLIERLLQINPTLSGDLAKEATEEPAAVKGLEAKRPTSTTGLPTRGMSAEEAMATTPSAKVRLKDAHEPSPRSRKVVAGTREPRAREKGGRGGRHIVGTLAQGDPPSILVCIDGTDTCMRSILREGLDLKVAFEPIAGLQLSDDVLIVFQMPDGTYLQVQGRVSQARTKRTILSARGVGDDMLKRIDRAIGLGK